MRLPGAKVDGPCCKPIKRRRWLRFRLSRSIRIPVSWGLRCSRSSLPLARSQTISIPLRLQSAPRSDQVASLRCTSIVPRTYVRENPGSVFCPQSTLPEQPGFRLHCIQNATSRSPSFRHARTNRPADIGPGVDLRLTHPPKLGAFRVNSFHLLTGTRVFSPWPSPLRFRRLCMAAPC